MRILPVLMAVLVVVHVCCGEVSRMPVPYLSQGGHESAAPLLGGFGASADGLHAWSVNLYVAVANGTLVGVVTLQQEDLDGGSLTYSIPRGAVPNGVPASSMFGAAKPAVAVSGTSGAAFAAWVENGAITTLACDFPSSEYPCGDASVNVHGEAGVGNADSLSPFALSVALSPHSEAPVIVCPILSSPDEPALMVVSCGSWKCETVTVTTMLASDLFPSGTTVHNIMSLSVAFGATPATSADATPPVVGPVILAQVAQQCYDVPDTLWTVTCLADATDKGAWCTPSQDNTPAHDVTVVRRSLVRPSCVVPVGAASAPVTLVPPSDAAPSLRLVYYDWQSGAHAIAGCATGRVPSTDLVSPCRGTTATVSFTSPLHTSGATVSLPQMTTVRRVAAGTSGAHPASGLLWVFPEAPTFPTTSPSAEDPVTVANTFLCPDHSDALCRSGVLHAPVTVPAVHGITNDLGAVTPENLWVYWLPNSPDPVTIAGFTTVSQPLSSSFIALLTDPAPQLSPAPPNVSGPPSALTSGAKAGIAILFTIIIFTAVGAGAIWWRTKKDNFVPMTYDEL